MSARIRRHLTTVLIGLAFTALGVGSAYAQALSIDDPAAVSEGGTIDFTVSVSPTSTSAISVNYSTAVSLGTATDGTDYTTATATLNIAANASSGTITITTTEDADAEIDEQFFVTLSTPSGATIADATGVGTIDDDDGPTVALTSSPSGELGSAALAEGTATTWTITATLTGDVLQDVTVPFTFSGTAVSGTDYTVAGTGYTAPNLVIPTGSPTGTLTVTILDDTEDEVTETLTVDIDTTNPPTNGSASASDPQVANISDDLADGPTVSLSSSASSFTESGTVTLTATLSPLSVEDTLVTFTYGSAAGDATEAAGADYADTGDASYNTGTKVLTVAAGNQTGTVTLTGAGDTKIEGTENVPVSIVVTGNGVASTSADSVALTLTDDDAAPVVTIAEAGGSAASVLDEASANTVTLQIELSTDALGTAPDEVTSVTLTFGGEAVKGTDYTVAGTNYVDATGVITFAIDDREEDIVLTIAADTLDDDGASGTGETLTVTVASVTGSGAVSTTANVHSLDVDDDDDNPTVTLTQQGPVLEDAGTATITATLNRASDQPVVINTTFTPVTASATENAVEGTDYSLSSGTGTYDSTANTLTIAAGETTGTLTVTGIADDLYEATEGFILTSTGVTTNAVSAVTGSPLTTEITDAESVPTVSIADAASTTEAGDVTLTVSLSGLTEDNVTVTYDTADISAVSAANEDYTDPGTVTVTITAGTLSNTTTVTTTADTADEANETFSVTIGAVTSSTTNDGANASIGAGSDPVAVATITDDDGPDVTLSSSADGDGAATAELAEGTATTWTITATLGALSTLQDVTVPFTFGGTATSADYTVSGTGYTAPNLVIGAGQTTGAITVTIVDDSVDDGPETLTVDIDTTTGVTNGDSGIVSDPQGANITDDTADGPTVSLTSSATSFTESGNVTLTATLSAVSGDATTVTFTYGSGTDDATEDTDYVDSGTSYAPNVLTIAAGNETATVVLTGQADTKIEGTENVPVSIVVTTNGAASGSADSVALTLTDDDAAPVVTIAEAGGSAASVLDEASANTVTLQIELSTDALGTAPDEVTSVTLTFGGEAVKGTDYTVAGTNYVDATGVITFAIDDREEDIVLTIAADTLDDDGASGTGETLTVTVASVTGSGAVSTTANVHSLDVDDDDDNPTVTLTQQGPVLEDAGTATITATLNRASDQPVVINTTFTPVTASATENAVEGTDYSLSSGTGTYDSTANTLTIAAGETTGTLTVTGIADDLYEATEGFILTSTGVTTNAVSAVTGSPLTTEITDAESVPTVTIADASATEASSVSFAVTLSGLTEDDVTVGYDTADVSATAGTDYTAISNGTVTITAGSLSAATPISVTTLTDATDEVNETFTVIIDTVATSTTNDGANASITASGSDPTAVGTINDDDGPTISIADTTPGESDASVTFTVTLSAPSSQSITVDYATSDGTATAAADYTAPASGTLTFDIGDTTQTTPAIVLLGDTLDEDDETFNLDLTNASNATITDAQGQATISDDDALPAISIADVTVAEGDSATVNASFDVTLSPVSGRQVTVVYTVSDGSAVSSGSVIDFVSGTDTLTFAAGDETKTVVVAVNGDTVDEADEQFFVFLTSETNVTLTDDRGTGTITDDDGPAVDLTVDAGTLAEAGGTATVTATLATLSLQDVTVVFTLAGEAVLDTDYAAAGVVPANYTTGSLTIPSASLSGGVVLTGTDDTVYEGDEGIDVTIASVNNGTAGTLNEVSATITEDESPPEVSLSISPDPAAIAEAGGVATVTATLDIMADEDVAVGLTFAGAATAVDDYTTSDESLVVSAGSMDASLTLTGVDDTLDDDGEDISVTLGAITVGSVSGTASSTANAVSATITDDDDEVTVAFAADAQSTAEGVAASLTVQLSRAVSSDVTVPYTVDTATSTADATDHDLVDGSIVVAAGELDGSVTVTPVADGVDEADETLVVLLGTPTNATLGTAATQTVTIATALTVTVAASANDGETVPVSADVFVPSGATIVTATVSYRALGAAAFTSDALDAPGGVVENGTWTGSIPASAVTMRGVDYFVQITDSAGNDFLEGSESSPEKLSVLGSVAVSVLTTPANESAVWNIIAPPVAPTSTRIDDSTFGDLGSYALANWLAFRWDPASESYEQPDDVGGTSTDVFETGAAWFVSADDISGTGAVDLTVAGTSANVSTDASGRIVIPIKGSTTAAMWNMVGNPFNFDFPWSDATVSVRKAGSTFEFTPTQADGDQTADGGGIVDWIDNTAWTWDAANTVFMSAESDDGTLSLAPGEGFFIRSAIDGELLLTPTEASVQAAARIAPLVVGKWGVELTVASGDAHDSARAVVADEELSSTGEAPPSPISGTAQVTLVRDASTGTSPWTEFSVLSVHETSEMRWTVDVLAAQGGELTWETWDLPDNYDLFLQEAGSMRSVDLRERQGIALDASERRRSFVLTARQHALVTQSRLLPNYPNPFNPETWIPFELSDASEVAITIYDVRGEVVRQLQLGYRPEGQYVGRAKAGYWDGRNELGERVASGLYLYEIKAGSFTQRRKMAVVK